MSGHTPVRLGTHTVHRLGFGAMRLTGERIWGEPDDRAECVAVLRRAVELGVEFIDTADSYGPGVSEEIIAEALHPYGDRVVVATKGGLLRPAKGVSWPTDGRPEHLRSACEQSLRRLRLDRIPLYQLHRPDPAVPYAESVGALADLQRQGLVEMIGVSNVSVEQLEIARSLVDVVSVQNRYSLDTRDSDDVLERCAALGIAFIPWTQFGVGSDLPELRAVATEVGATIHQVTLAWLLRRSPITLLIPGTSKVDHLQSNVAACDVALSDDQVRRLDRVAPTAALP